MPVHEVFNLRHDQEAILLQLLFVVSKMQSLLICEA
jgi:hypothetical protein